MSGDSFRRVPYRRRPLPEERNIDGRPVWEPPVLRYGALIDAEEHAKKRESILKFTGGDVVRTTQILDLDEETEVLFKYFDWLERNKTCDRPDSADGGEHIDGFFHELWRAVGEDLLKVAGDWKDLGIKISRSRDGTWCTEIHPDADWMREPPSDTKVGDASGEKDDEQDKEAKQRIQVSQQPSIAGPFPLPLALHMVSLSQSQNRARIDGETASQARLVAESVD